MELTAGSRIATRSRCRALIVSAVVTVLTLPLAASAQAHEPWGAKAWGASNRGQLGNGTETGPEKCNKTEETACSTVPVAVSGLSGVTAIAAGDGGLDPHALAILENGTAVAWGSGTAGALGDGTETNSDIPVGVCEVGYTGPTPCPAAHYLKGVRAVAASATGFSVALLENGTVVDWGEIPFAKLGDGKTARSSVPVAVCEVGYAAATPCAPEHALKEVTAIAASSRFALALHGARDEVAAWGSNSLNSGNVFGDGRAESGGSQNVPVAVCAAGEKAPCASNLSGVSAIAAGQDKGLALAGGKVVDWGEGFSGALGNGSEKGANAPVEVQGLTEEATAIAGGAGFGMALLKGGTLEAWGNNEDGQLGNGVTTPPGPEECGETFKGGCSKKAISAAGGLRDVATIAAGGDQALAVAKSGAVYAWGANADGQLGVGTSEGPEHCGAFLTSCSGRPLVVSGAAAARGLSGGERFSLSFGPPPPTVTAISPSEGKKMGAGTKVTITGADFEEATEVKFGSAKATSFTVNSQSSITAVAPTGKGTVDVTVTTPAGTSATSEADRFYYSRPAIKRLSPKKGPELGGTTVTITGSNFSGVTAVNFGSTAASSFKVKSETEIVAVSPAHPAGTVAVTVSTPNGTSAARGKDRFKYR
jgi:alpha-tubulin suppressor-like RCC1 family protein/spore coat protein U-like protein